MSTATKVKTSRIYKKIPESWNIKNYIDNLPKEFLDSKTNREFLNNGAFGVVYKGKDENKVLKVCELQSAYAEYIRALYKSKLDNPHFPKIDEIDIFRFDDKVQILAVEMEKLETLWSETSPLREQVYDIVDLFDFDHRLRAATFNEYIKKYPQFWAAREFLEKTYKEVNAKRRKITNDIGQSNVMVRGDVPVVTDPFC